MEMKMLHTFSPVSSLWPAGHRNNKQKVLSMQMSPHQKDKHESNLFCVPTAELHTNLLNTNCS